MEDDKSNIDDTKSQEINGLVLFEYSLSPLKRSKEIDIDYQQQQHEVIGKIAFEVEVYLAADETFFD